LLQRITARACGQHLHATVGCTCYSAKASYKTDARHAANDSACVGSLYRLRLGGPAKATYKGSLHQHRNHTITPHRPLPTDLAAAFGASVSSARRWFFLLDGQKERDKNYKITTRAMLTTLTLRSATLL